MQAGVLAGLTYAANNRRLLLTNFYQKGVNAIKKGKEETPRAFVIPKKQSDPVMAAYLVNQLRGQGIEVHKSTSDDYVVLLEQPYRNLAVSLLTKQNYPKDTKQPSYDDIAWTLGYLDGVDVKALDNVSYAASDLKLLTEDAKYTGKVDGAGINYVIHYKAQNTVLPALYWLKNQNKTSKALVLEAKTTLEGVKDTLSAGSVVLQGITADEAKSITSQFGLDLAATTATATVKQHEVTLPRVAIYHSWFNTQDEGWVRFTFDQRGIPYTSIEKDDLKAGDLRKNTTLLSFLKCAGRLAILFTKSTKNLAHCPIPKRPNFHLMVFLMLQPT